MDEVPARRPDWNRLFETAAAQEGFFMTNRPPRPATRPSSSSVAYQRFAASGGLSQELRVGLILWFL